MNIEDIKAKIILFIILIAVVLAVFIPTYLIVSKKEDNEYFPYYDEIKYDKNKVNDVNSEEYKLLKRRLENDNLLARESLISEYDYNSFKPSNLKDLIWNYIFSYELSTFLRIFISLLEYP